MTKSGSDPSAGEFGREPSRQSDARAVVEEGLGPAIADLPPDKRKLIVSTVTEVVDLHAGPLPHPQTLSAYDRALPGLAERIVVMAESELKHQQDFQRRQLATQVWERSVGQFSAAAITLVALVVAGWIATSGYPVTGGLLGGATLLGVVSIFIGGREYLLSRLRDQGPPSPTRAPSKPRQPKR